MIYVHDFGSDGSTMVRKQFCRALTDVGWRLSFVVPGVMEVIVMVISCTSEVSDRLIHKRNFDSSPLCIFFGGRR